MPASSSPSPTGVSMKSTAPACISPYCHVHVAIAGDHDGRQPVASVLQPLQQLEPAHAGHHGIDQEASIAARTIGFEERLGTGIDLDRLAIFLEHIAHRVAHGAVVVDRENDRALRRIT
jgi:hypothetical protein